MPKHVWHKAPSGLISPHFRWSTEVACNHCGRVCEEAECLNTARWLERIRSEVFEDRRILINSWCRCPAWNLRVGGAPQSYHVKGMAVDITVDGLTPRQVHNLCAKFQGPRQPIGGLGKYNSWVHIDRGPARRWNGP